MFNFLVAAAPDLDAVQAYFDSIPGFVVGFYVLVGFIYGFLFWSVNGVIEEITAYFRQRRLKKRVDKSAKELMEYVDKVINRDTVDIDSPEQTDTKTTERRNRNA